MMRMNAEDTEFEEIVDETVENEKDRENETVVEIIE